MHTKKFLQIMIKKFQFLSVLFLFSCAIIFYSCSSQESLGNSKSSEESQNNQFKVVGYLPSRSFVKSSQIDYCKLTHLNLAFANPDAEGNLLIEGAINTVINDAKAANPSIQISISLAGGYLTDDQAKNWSNLIDKAENRPSFIKKIVNFVQENNFDGVDVDLEWDYVTRGYSGFVLELKTALSKYNKTMTAALPNNFRFENITNQALKSFDFINIMSYDSTGPWAPENPGQHSSFENSKVGIKFWKETQGVSKQKLTLGVPFYGYNFTYKEITGVSYNDLVLAGTEFAEKDELGKIYYNGRPTIRTKVELASKEIAGIMIWELGQDSFNEYSLLDVIHKKLTSLNIKTTGLCGN